MSDEDNWGDYGDDDIRWTRPVVPSGWGSRASGLACGCAGDRSCRWCDGEAKDEFLADLEAQRELTGPALAAWSRERREGDIRLTVGPHLVEAVAVELDADHGRCGWQVVTDGRRPVGDFRYTRALALALVNERAVALAADSEDVA